MISKQRAHLKSHCKPIKIEKGVAREAAKYFDFTVLQSFITFVTQHYH